MLDKNKLLGFKLIQDGHDTENALISAKIGVAMDPAPPASVLTAPAPESGSTVIIGMSSGNNLILDITGTRSGGDSTGVNTGDYFTLGEAVWGNASYGFGDVDNDGTVSGFDYKTYGFTLGVDLYKNTDKNTLFGAFLDFNNFDIDLNNTNASSDVDYYQFGVYGGAELAPHLHINMATSIGYADLSSSRTTAAGTAVGDTAGIGYSIGFEVSHDNLIKPVNDWAFSPFVSMQLDSIDMNSYSEKGPGAARVTPDRNSQLLSTLGLTISKNIEHDTFTSTPSLSIGWAHEFLDDTASSQASLVGGGATFNNTAVDVGDDFLSLDASYAIPVKENSGFSLDYNGKYNSDAIDNKLSVGFNYTW